LKTLVYAGDRVRRRGSTVRRRGSTVRRRGSTVRRRGSTQSDGAGVCPAAESGVHGVVTTWGGDPGGGVDQDDPCTAAARMATQTAMAATPRGSSGRKNSSRRFVMACHPAFLGDRVPRVVHRLAHRPPWLPPVETSLARTGRDRLGLRCATSTRSQRRQASLEARWTSCRRERPDDSPGQLVRVRGLSSIPPRTSRESDPLTRTPISADPRPDPGPDRRRGGPRRRPQRDLHTGFGKVATPTRRVSGVC
jgi:hypothetical protein